MKLAEVVVWLCEQLRDASYPRIKLKTDPKIFTDKNLSSSVDYSFDKGLFIANVLEIKRIKMPFCRYFMNKSKVQLS